MGQTIEAVFENGVLRPLTNPGLKDREQVRILILPKELGVEETAGMFGPIPEELARHIAEDDDVLWEGK